MHWLGLLGLILAPILVLGRLDLSPAEPQAPSFSYCIGNSCDQNRPNPEAGLNDEGIGPESSGFCDGNQTTFHEDPKDCHDYFICYKGAAAHQTCPDDMAYSHESKLCVSEEHVKGCTVAIDCRRNGIVQDPKDCMRYYNCFYGYPYHLRCPDGTRFDPIARQCTSTIPCLTTRSAGLLRQSQRRRILRSLIFKV